MAFKSTSAIWINRITTVLFIGLILSVCMFILKRKQVVRGVAIQKPEMPYKPHEGLNADEIFYRTTTISFPWPSFSSTMSTPPTYETPSTSVTRKVTPVRSKGNLEKSKDQNQNNSISQTILKKVLNVSKDKENIATVNKENKKHDIITEDKNNNIKIIKFESSSQKAPNVQMSEEKNSKKETVKGTKENPETKLNSKTKAISETKVSSEAKVSPETKLNSKTKAISETKVSSEAKVSPETKVNTKTKASSETKVNTETKVSPETKLNSKTKAIPETKVSSEAKVSPETKVNTETKVSPETKVNTETKASSETKVSPETKVNTKTKASSETKLSPETKLNPQTKVIIKENKQESKSNKNNDLPASDKANKSAKIVKTGPEDSQGNLANPKEPPKQAPGQSDSIETKVAKQKIPTDKTAVKHVRLKDGTIVLVPVPAPGNS